MFPLFPLPLGEGQGEGEVRARLNPSPQPSPKRRGSKNHKVYATYNYAGDSYDWPARFDKA